MTITKEMVDGKTGLRFQHKTKITKSMSLMRVRQTGKVLTWKTRADDFKIPVKFGMYQSGYITQDNASEWDII